MLITKYVLCVYWIKKSDITYAPKRYINVCFIIAFPVRITSASWWRKQNGDVTLSSLDLRKESVGEQPGESARVSTKHQQPIRESVQENRGVAQVFPHFSIFGWQRGARQPGDARGCVASADQESSNPEDRSCSCPRKRNQSLTFGWGCRSRLEDAFEDTFSCSQNFPIVPKQTGWSEVGVKHSFGKSIRQTYSTLYYMEN